MRFRFQFMTIGIIVALTAAAAPARAGFSATVYSGVTPEAGGLYLYSYLVLDASASTLAVSEFDLSLPVDANLMSISAPTGFLSLYTTGDMTISFVSTDPSTDIAPGMFGSFSFTSTDAPGLGNYSLLTYDDIGFGAGDVVSGVSIAPNAVPEPGSLILIGLGLPGVIAMIVRRRQRPALSGLTA